MKRERIYNIQMRIMLSEEDRKMLETLANKRQTDLAKVIRDAVRKDYQQELQNKAK